jgi:hypothetical protein
MNRIRLNARTDVVMGILLVLTAFSWRNHWAHIVLGIALVVAAAVHLLLHRKWLLRHTMRFARPGGRPLRGRTRLHLMVDVSVGALFIVSVMSGFALVISDPPLWTGLHSVSSWWMFLGAVIHLTAHARWVVRNARRTVSAQPA